MWLLNIKDVSSELAWLIFHYFKFHISPLVRFILFLKTFYQPYDDMTTFSLLLMLLCPWCWLLAEPVRVLLTNTTAQSSPDLQDVRVSLCLRTDPPGISQHNICPLHPGRGDITGDGRSLACCYLDQIIGHILFLFSLKLQERGEVEIRSNCCWITS